MDPLSVTASVVGLAAAAMSSARRLHSFIGDIRQAPKTLLELADELEALSSVLEFPEIEQFDTYRGITKGQKNILLDCLEILDACKLTCDELHSELGNITKHSSPWENISQPDRLRRKTPVISQALVRFRSWGRSLHVSHIVMQFKPNTANRAEKNNLQEQVMESGRMVITLRMEAESKLKELREELDDWDETDPSEQKIVEQVLLPMEQQLASLSQSVKLCETALQALEEESEFPEITDNVMIESSHHEDMRLIPIRRTDSDIIARDHSVQHVGSMNRASFGAVMGFSADDFFA